MPKCATPAPASTDSLHKHGYVVIECLPSSKLKDLRNKIDQEIAAFPEYLPDAKIHVLGGFGAYGNPSSFHNTTVRQMRQWALAAAVPAVWKPYTKKHFKDANLEQCIDRFMRRLPGKAPGTEEWHRDEAKGMEPGDQVFGGWINLDDMPQTFHCVPGTHKVPNVHAGGFHSIPKTEHPSHRSNCVTVTIPPGNMLIFFEHIVHEVVSRKAKYKMYRLFTGWRLTKSTQPLQPASRKGLETMLQNQAVMKIKSGQIPPMWPKLSWTNHRVDLEKFSIDNIRSELLVNQTVGSGLKKGDVHTIVPRFLSSLGELGLPKYPAYTANEIAMHLPRRQWRNILLPGRKRVRGHFRL